MKSNSKPEDRRIPYISRGTVGIISRAVMSFSGKDILLVEGNPDQKTYNKIVQALGKTNIYVLPVYQKGRYLDSGDVEMLGKPNDVSPKLSIILLVKRCFAREWAKGSLLNKFFGIVDKDWFFEEEMECVNDSILTYSTPMSDEDWKTYFFDAVSNGRLITTDTNDVETLIFKFDFDAVKKACHFAAAKYNLDQLKDEALNRARKAGKKQLKKEKKYLELEDKSFFDIDDDWAFCKGHSLVEKFHDLVDKDKQHFKTEKQFINSVINNISPANFTDSAVYKFIDSIEPNPDLDLNTITF